MADTISRREGADARIQFFSRHGRLAPAHKMLDDPLVELVKNVWGDGGVNVCKGETSPEGCIDTTRDVKQAATRSKNTSGGRPKLGI